MGDKECQRDNTIIAQMHNVKLKMSQVFYITHRLQIKRVGGLSYFWSMNCVPMKLVITFLSYLLPVVFKCCAIILVAILSVSHLSKYWVRKHASKSKPSMFAQLWSSLTSTTQKEFFVQKCFFLFSHFSFCATFDYTLLSSWLDK